MLKIYCFRRTLCLGLIFAFLLNTIGPLPAYAHEPRLRNLVGSEGQVPQGLPKPGVMVHLSAPVNPPLLKGIKVHPDNPFRFDFILDTGYVSVEDTDNLRQESSRLIKYFLASLTTPEADLWVNLSPYEKNRIVPESFGQTEMGRDLLAQDYMLKQITASLMYPEDGVGKRFWKRIYEESAKRYGTTNIPVNTFNKVWIVPEKAVVYENAKAGTAYVVESRLKVMLEEDYVSVQKHSKTLSSPNVLVGDLGHEGARFPTKAFGNDKDVNIGNQIIREIVIPELTKEINEGSNFAQLRQVYNSLILATWYKKKIKDSIFTKVYVDRNKVVGLGYMGGEPQQIYQRYLNAFKKGVYNYIKEESDPISQKRVTRKYFSGGTTFNDQAMNAVFHTTQDGTKIIKMAIDNSVIVQVGIKDFAMASTKLKSPSDILVYTPENGATVKKGRITGAKPVEIFPNAIWATRNISQLVQGNEFLVDIPLTKDKKFRLLGVDWNLRGGSEGERIVAQFRKEDGNYVLITAYNEAGEVIYEKDIDSKIEQNKEAKVYTPGSGAKIENGKIVGKPTDKFPQNAATRRLLELNLEEFYLDVKLNSGGQLNLFQENWWGKKTEYADQRVSVHFKKEKGAYQLVAAYDKDGNLIYPISEDEQIQLFIPSDKTRIENGKVIGTPSQTYSNKHTAIKSIDLPEFYIKLRLNQYGGLNMWGQQMAPRKGYENAEVLVHFKKFEDTYTAIAIYDANGEQIEQEAPEQVVIYIPKEGTRLENGKIVGKASRTYDSRIWAARELMTDIANSPEEFYTELTLTDKGGFSFFSKWWASKKGYEKAKITAHFRKVKNEYDLVAVYDSNGQEIYSQNKQQEGKIEIFTPQNGSHIKDGLLQAGQPETVLYHARSVPTYLEDHPLEEFFVRTHLDDKGGFYLMGEHWWTSKSGSENVEVVVHFKKNEEGQYELEAAYDQKGQDLTVEKEPIKIYASRNGATIVQGKISGQPVSQFPKKTQALRLLKQLDSEDIYLEVTLSNDGGFLISSYRKLALPGYENTKVLLHFQNKNSKKNLINVYDSQGNVIWGEIYDSKTRVYIADNEVKLNEGKVVGQPAETFTTQRDAIKFVTARKIKEFYLTTPLTSQAGIYLGRDFWQSDNIRKHQNSLATLHFRLNEGSQYELVASYDQDGRRLNLIKVKSDEIIEIHTSEGGSKIENGFIVGEPIEISSSKLAAQQIVSAMSHSDVFVKMRIGEMGKISFMGHWASRSNSANKEVHSHFKKQDMRYVLVAAYEAGQKIYPKEENEQDKISIYSAHTGAVIEEGKIKGQPIETFSDKIQASLTIQSMGLTDFFVKMRLDGQGKLYFLGRHWWGGKKGHEDAEVLIHFKKSPEKGYELIDAYDNQGNLIYPTGKRDPYSVERKRFNVMIGAEEAQKLLETLGLEATFGLLSRAHGFTPTFLAQTLTGYAEKIQSEGNQFGYASNRSFSFVQARQSNVFSKIEPDKLDVVVETLIRSMYKDVVEDNHFLNVLREQSENPSNGDMLQKAYKQVADYYDHQLKIEMGGIDETAILPKLYQRIGAQFLIDRKHAILADEPGLGKTLEAIMAVVNVPEFDKDVRDAGYREGEMIEPKEKILIIAPKRAADRVWKREIQAYTTGRLKVEVVNRSKIRSRSTVDKNPELNLKRRFDRIKQAQVLIVNPYAIAGEDGNGLLLREHLKQFKYKVIILDEAHNIRNESTLTDAVREFDAEYKFALTATPLVGQTVAKLFNLLQWLYPERYKDKWNFSVKYAGREKAFLLRQELRPFLLRRTKVDVTDMPLKNYVNVPVSLTDEERQFYLEVANYFSIWIKSSIRQNDPKYYLKILSQLSRLRLAALNTGLIIRLQNNGEKIFAYTGGSFTLGNRKYRFTKEKEVIVGLKDEEGHEFRFEKGKSGTQVTIDKKVYEVQVKDNLNPSRYLAIDKIIEEKIAKGEKVILNTNYREVVFQLAARYKHYGVNYAFGDMTSSQVDSEIEAFQENPDQKIFIATYGSGSEAISLTAANNVIEVDKPTYPLVRIQANDRPHRWGQDKIVNIYRLTGIDTIDEYFEFQLTRSEALFRLLFEVGEPLPNFNQEIIKELLRELKYPDEIIDHFLKIHEGLGAKVNNQPPDTVTNEFIDQSSGISMRFTDGNISGRFSTNQGFVEPKTTSQLVSIAKDLTDPSKKFLRNFLEKRLTEEINLKVPIKQSVLWSLLNVLMPQLTKVDTNYSIERNLEIGRIVISLLLQNPSLKYEDLLGSVNDQLSLSKALYFLDERNIFKLFSLLGVLDQQYYFDGELLSYASPLKLGITNGNLVYTDEKIVNAIAPDRYREPKLKTDPNRSFQNLARRYRFLTREEEIRLGREAGKGNLAARVALVEAHYYYIVDTTYRIIQRQLKERALISSSFFKLDRKTLYEDLYALGQNVLYELSSSYYIESKTINFRNYVRPKFLKAIIAEFYRQIRLVDKEKKTLDVTVEPRKGRSFIRAENVKSDEYLSPMSLNPESSIAIAITKILEANGYRDQEIQAYFMAMTEQIVPKKIAHDLKISIRQIRSIVDDAKIILQGSKQLQQDFHSIKDADSADEAMKSRKGGIDFTDDKISLGVQRIGDGIKFNMDPAILNRLQNAPGFYPVIINIAPLSDLNTFLSLN